MELKKGQTVYVTKENDKLQNTPRSGIVHKIGGDHVVLKTKGGSTLYKTHKDNISTVRGSDWMSKKYPVSEDAPTNVAGSGDVAGIGVDKTGKPGSGEPGIKRKSLKQFIQGK